VTTQRVSRLLRRPARWLASRRPVRVRAGHAAGMRMDLRRASAWYARGDNERPIQNAIAANLAPGDVFLDIGANVGFFSLIAARAVGPRGRVYAFDPVPANAAAIRRNAALNRLASLEVIQAAVCASDDQSELVLARHPGGAVLTGRGQPPDARGRIQVRTVSIDRLVMDGRVSAPTLVKIDVEGGELDVLRGMVQTARACTPRIICELDDPDLVALESKIAAVDMFLNELGYTVTRLERAYGQAGVAHLLATGDSSPRRAD
jgi:FkbM family methyltransferase